MLLIATCVQEACACRLLARRHAANAILALDSVCCTAGQLTASTIASRISMHAAASALSCRLSFLQAASKGELSGLKLALKEAWEAAEEADTKLKEEQKNRKEEAQANEKKIEELKKTLYEYQKHFVRFLLLLSSSLPETPCVSLLAYISLELEAWLCRAHVAASEQISLHFGMLT